jgi:hypothetical protein
MAARSATPAEQRKETRRSVPMIAATAADVTAWSPNKVLMQYGRSIGIDLDDLPNVDTLQQRIDQITQSWNDLPIHERQRLMPHPGDERLPGRDRAMRAYGIDDPIEALLLSFATELPSGKLPEPETVAPLVQSSPYMRQVIALCDWMGERVEVTATGVLRPATAHEAYDALGLVEWTEQQLRRQYARYHPPAMVKMGAEEWIAQRLHQGWRSAADCPALDRLWRGAVACGAVRLSGKWAYPRFPPEPDADQWVRMGLSAVIRLLEDECAHPGRAAGLVYGLLRSYARRCAPVPWQEVLAFLLDWRSSAEEQAYYRSFAYDPTPLDWSSLAGALWQLADTRIFVETGDAMQLTLFGDVAVTAWLNYRRQPTP